MIIKKENSIIKKTGDLPGKTLAVFAGVHGNEKAGVFALQKILKEIKITKGVVYFVFANLQAIEKDARCIEKNLNRCFLKGNTGVTYEDKRAQELMPVLDECDVLLDLHASPAKKTIPFIICEKNSLDIIKNFDFEIVSFGWNTIEPGATDGYMNEQGKIGICLECGLLHESENKANLAEKSVYQFLQYFDAIDSEIPFSNYKQKVLQVKKAIKKKSEDFKFVRSFDDFEKLEEDELIASDGNEKYYAKKNECILFANPKNKKIGDEVFIIGEFIDKKI